MTPSTHHIIPESERYCIWMDAGVVDYKLCTCLFKCDECEFDAQIRTHTNAARSNETHQAQAQPVTPVRSSRSADDYYAMMLQNVLRSIEGQSLPEDRFYSSQHTWAKEDGDGLYVLGIDHFIGTMLGAAHSVAFSVSPTHIKAGEPYAWIVANGETVAVRSPIAGTIVENNTALADRSSVIHSDPYTKGWIAKIRPDETVSTLTLRRSDKAAQVMKDDCARYEDRIHSELQRLQTHIDSTMYDGGTALENFEEMFGTKKYYELLEGFLRP